MSIFVTLYLLVFNFPKAAQLDSKMRMICSGCASILEDRGMEETRSIEKKREIGKAKIFEILC